MINGGRVDATRQRYAEVLGLAASPDDIYSTVDGGRAQRITPEHVRHVVRSGWSMIEASVTPLLVLLGSRLLGASAGAAVNIALSYTVFLLVALGWLVATAFAAVLGLIVVVLKASLH